jgi:hypothetical protein
MNGSRGGITDVQMKRLFMAIGYGQITASHLEALLRYDAALLASGHNFKAPNLTQLKELYDRIQKHRISTDRLERFLLGSLFQYVTVERAKRLLGANHVFGPAEWRKYFGKAVNIPEGAVPPIPLDSAALLHPGLAAPHFLFLGLEQFEGEPLNLLKYLKMYASNLAKGAEPSFTTEARESEIYRVGSADKWVEATCSFAWYLMPIGSLTELERKDLAVQTDMVPWNYRVSSVIERVTANVLFFLLNNSYLDNESFVRVSDRKAFHSPNIIEVGHMDHMRSANVGINIVGGCSSLAAPYTGLSLTRLA